jgi:prepilin-type N-terminal cleavage/methylation domain-containing protein
MKKGFTLPELTIALSILLLSAVVLVSLGTSYLSILNSYRQRFLTLNIAQEGIELALALRNKQIERGIASNWLGVTNAGSYCLQFDINTGEIRTISSSTPCETFRDRGGLSYRRLVSYSDFENPNNNNLTSSRAVKVVSEVYFGREKISLDIILTKWHPVQYP